MVTPLLLYLKDKLAREHSWAPTDLLLALSHFIEPIMVVLVHQRVQMLDSKDQTDKKC